ncbi:MAG: hypothetical protein ABL994_21300, partial [Verrucomicrobiales bacterium]
MKNPIGILSDMVSKIPFEARHGLYAAAGGITFEACPEFVSKSTVDLRITLRPGHICEPPDDSARQADRQVALRCVELRAGSKTKPERMAAAQQMGTLRWTEDRAAVEQAAREDPDADVRIVAARALALLDADRVAACDLADLQVSVATDLAGRFAGRTDASGRTRIAGLPALAGCR